MTRLRAVSVGQAPIAEPAAALCRHIGAAPVDILGIPFSPLGFDDAVERIGELIDSGTPHQIVLANAHTVKLAGRDPSYHAILRSASLVLRDGFGLELASMLAARRLRDNFVGTDFVPRLLTHLEPRRPRVFLYGAAPGVADAVAHTLSRRCPGIEVVGTEHGYGSREAAAKQVDAVSPDILLVALGNPLQEQWIAENLAQMNVRVAIGVGALFDYLAGRVPRAPRLVRTLRSEWIFRLAIEPRRLWHRYLIGNFEFVWLVLRSRRGRA